MKTKVLFSAAFMLATVGAYAQGNGIAGITEATNKVTSYYDPDTSKTPSSWFGACIFLIVAATILRSFFLKYGGLSNQQRDWS